MPTICRRCSACSTEVQCKSWLRHSSSKSSTLIWAQTRCLPQKFVVGFRSFSCPSYFTFIHFPHATSLKSSSHGDAHPKRSKHVKQSNTYITYSFNIRLTCLTVHTNPSKNPTPTYPNHAQPSTHIRPSFANPPGPDLRNLLSSLETEALFSTGSWQRRSLTRSCASSFLEKPWIWSNRPVIGFVEGTIYRKS